MEKLSQIFEKIVFDGIAPVCQKVFGHGERYIKVDGSKFHSKPLKSFFEKAAFKAYAVTTGAVVGGDFLLNGQYDGDLSTLAMSVGFGALCTYRIQHFDRTISSMHLFCCKAIDTEGRELKRKMLSLSDLSFLEKNKSIDIRFLTGHIGIAITGLATLQEASFLIVGAPYIAKSLGDAYRFHMLIKGHTPDLEFEDNIDTPNVPTRKKDNGYVICDEPPAKTEKAKKSLLSLGGLTNPAP